MSAGVYNIEIEQGGDFSLAVTYKDSAGAVFDLSSGYTATMNIKESDLSESFIDSLTTASGEITLSSGTETTQSGTISIDSTQTLITVTIATGEHGYSVGDFITMLGGAPDEYNGVKEITATPTASTFTLNAEAGDTITDSSVTFYKIAANMAIDIGNATTATYDFSHAFYDLELSQQTTNAKVLRGTVNLIKELN
jgi:hypothetical protein|tara:strand:+ start:856 stop:1443 length:588 start_codon:yes stop_codon:yes gene_type:complete